MGWDEALREAGGEIEVLCRMELSIPTLCAPAPEFYLSRKQESDNLWPHQNTFNTNRIYLFQENDKNMFIIINHGKNNDEWNSDDDYMLLVWRH